MISSFVVQPTNKHTARRRQSLRAVCELLASAQGDPFEIVHAGRRIVLPSELVESLKVMAGLMAANHGVVIASHDETLTSQQVADLLNVSRPHVIKMAHQGDLTFTMAGTHHRFDLSEVERVRAKVRRQRGAG